MRDQRKQFVAGIAFVILILIVPLVVGVWIPDVIFAPRNVLAEKQTTSGESVRVVQYWNRIDFYNTELEYVQTNGVVTRHVLDGDDSKTWSVPLVIDWQAKTAKVTLSGGRVRVVHLVRGHWEF